MIYFIALILSVAVCAQSIASGIVSGNLTHLKHGREPSAGVSLFPMIPLFQLLALGLAWLLEQYMPRVAMLALAGLFLALFAIWLITFKRSKAELTRAIKVAEHDQHT